MKFPGRKITFPIVLDDKWNREALDRYMSTTREKAVYLPSNIEYLSRNNGLSGAVEALEKLVASDWVGLNFQTQRLAKRVITACLRCWLLLGLSVSCSSM